MPATPPPSFTAWPPTPQRLVDAPDAYITKADPWADHLPVASAEMAAAAANVYANALQVQDVADDAEASALSAAAAAAAALGVTTRVGSSTTSNSVGSGPKTFAITESGRTLHQCTAVLIGAKADLDSVMYLVIDAGASSAGSITGTVATDGYRIGPGGSGPYSAWQIIDAFYAQQGADGADVREAASGFLSVPPKALLDAAATLALTDATTVAWNTNLGLVASLTLTANGHTVGAPTNLKANWNYTLYINPATYTCSWNAVWDFGAATAPSLPPSTWSRVEGRYNAALGKIQVSVWRGA